ncbi:MAG: 16S rRNA (uracil(1498)-N(3))-methyltransferase [Bacteroidia bacterium]|nr:16S rRNA (uracil(1498)-N(3))-methyltransferase [Bacteroidia bacterium]NNF32434.1 16S rRNA (uracil(1498)-N(3))-methyltransferase [Flavobacteriaceae bacterium]NNJ82152.1 16S rRNA (uracil(1498)-N(3))-methyltransferase [Flavobacteriaceae bacterium]NNK54245.1 16S rRNA (uracil(1498)-N(3))-methyltransferase [Flavobacteriaceae bacterium]
MQLFYHPDITAESKEIIFNKDESRHISRVLRKKPGDELNITNGRGSIFTAGLTVVEPKQAIARIQGSKEIGPLPYQLHLAVAPTKLNDRYEWFLEKATEIGVTEISPIICEHSERKVIKPERFERILQSAMKQSLKAWIPKLNPAVTFSEFLRQENKVSVRCIAHCEDSEKKSLKHTISPGESVILLIGPEGDFSSDEIRQAISRGYSEVHLGNSRLRTETAAIVACQSVAFINEV